MVLCETGETVVCLIHAPVRSARRVLIHRHPKGCITLPRLSDEFSETFIVPHREKLCRTLPLCDRFLPHLQILEQECVWTSDEETLMTVMMVEVVDMEIDASLFPLASHLEWVPVSTVAGSLSMFGLDENVCKFIEKRLRSERRESACSGEAPWTHCGYYTNLLRVVPEELKKQRGLPIDRLGTLEQLYCSRRSVIYRICLENDTKNVLYVKGVHCSNPELFNITRLLTYMPNEFDGYVCTIPDVAVLVMQDFGKSLEDLGSSAGEHVGAGVHQSAEDVSKEIFDLWADVQQKSIDHVDALAELGYPRYCRNWVKSKIEGVVQICTGDNVEVDVPDNAIEICKEDVDKVFDIWDESGIPATLVHGDFHEGNISHIDVDGNCAKIHIFDFEFSYIGCPLSDLTNREGGIWDYDVHYLKWWERFCGWATLDRLACAMKRLNELMFAILVMESKHVFGQEKIDFIERSMCTYFTTLLK